MTDKMTVWNHAVETVEAFVPFYREPAVANLRRANGRKSWLPYLRIAGSGPTQLSADRLADVTPYSAAEKRREMMVNILERGLMSPDRPGWYRLTDQGRAVLLAFFDCAQSLIASAPALPEAEMRDLAALLGRIVNSAARLPLPAPKVNFESSRVTDPGAMAHPAVRVEQYLTDLMHLRADAHHASWRAYGVDGRSWETLTYIWRDLANDPTALAGALKDRGYAEEDYARAIDLLLDRGWIEQAAGRWQVTGVGRAVRQVAEQVTDRLFFASWNALSDEEAGRLDDLLVRLRQRLFAAAGSQAAVRSMRVPPAVGILGRRQQPIPAL
jgi:hypothetical protein